MLADKSVMSISLVARADYALDGANVYLLIGNDGTGYRPYYGNNQSGRFGLGDNEEFQLTVQPGVSGSVGSASWDVGLKFDYQKDKPMLISVPLVLSMGF